MCAWGFKVCSMPILCAAWTSWNWAFPCWWLEDVNALLWNRQLIVVKGGGGTGRSKQRMNRRQGSSGERKDRG